MKSEIPLVEGPADTRLTFALQLCSSRRSVQLARRITVRHLAAWGYPKESDSSQAAAILVAELCGNAVTHGRVPGRDFDLRLTADPPAAWLRIEVSDASRTVPLRSCPEALPPDAECGRGLLLVEALATRWGVADRDPIGKTVWAELDLPRAPDAPDDRIAAGGTPASLATSP